MANENSGEWHGTALQGEDPLPSAPPIPDDYVSSPAGEALIDHDRRYRQVDFSGNYGAYCQQYQEFTRYNITEGQIRQIGWAAFGLCPGWTAERSE